MLHRGIVLDDQQPFALALLGGQRPGGGGGGAGLWLGESGEIDLHVSALAHLADHPHKAVAGFDNAQHRGQPQPGTLAGRFGGKKRVKDAIAQVGVNAGARVGYGEPYVLARLGIEVGLGQGRIHRHQLR